MWTDSQPRTLECVYTLEASDVILSRGSDVAVDEQVNDALAPVLEFCTRMARYTRDRTQVADLSSNHAENMYELRLHMTEVVEEIMNDHPDCFKDISIHQMFSNWHDGGLPTELAGSRAVVRKEQRPHTQDYADEDEDTQRAIMASLELLNQQQQDMRDYYKSVGGEDPLMAEDEVDDEGEDIDIPSMDRILEHIPDSGISFFDLTKSLGIHNLKRELLQHIADGVYQGATVKGDGKLYPSQPLEFPSDDDVKALILTSIRVADLRDLYKLAKVRHLERARLEEWSDGLFARGVIADYGDRLKVGDGAQDSTTSKTPSGTNTTRETPSRRPGLPAGSPFENMPKFATPASQTDTSDPGKGGSAEHRPASVPPITETDTPVKHLEDFAKLPAEMVRVRAAVLAHVRQWKTTFPRPGDCTWPELESIERSTVIRHINAYLSLNGLLSQPGTQTNTIDHLLNNDPAFPVAAAKNLKAITSGVKKVYQEYGAKLKKDAAARAEGDASDGSDEDARQDDDASGGAPTPRPAGGRGGLRPRAAATASAGSAAEDSHRTGGTGSKRTRVGSPENEGDADVQAPPKKSARKKHVVSDDSSDSDE